MKYSVTLAKERVLTINVENINEAIETANAEKTAEEQIISIRSKR